MINLYPRIDVKDTLLDVLAWIVIFLGLFMAFYIILFFAMLSILMFAGTIVIVMFAINYSALYGLLLALVYLFCGGYFIYLGYQLIPEILTGVINRWVYIWETGNILYPKHWKRDD